MFKIKPIPFLDSQDGLRELDRPNLFSRWQVGQMTGQIIDDFEIRRLAQEIVRIVDEDNEWEGPGEAVRFYDTLTNDERIVLGKLTRLMKPEGCRKTYWSVFNTYLEMGRHERD